MNSEKFVTINKIAHNTISITFPEETKAVLRGDVPLKALLEVLAYNGNPSGIAVMLQKPDPM